MAKFRNAHKGDEAFDTMTAEEIRRIRGAAEVMVTPGFGSLIDKAQARLEEVAATYDKAMPKSMKGRRA